MRLFRIGVGNRSSARNRSVVRFLTTLALLAAASPHASAGQTFFIPEPPRRSKDNHHQASMPQHKHLEVMIWAWIDNITPHVATQTRQQLYGRFAEELQNQYSEHAVWTFRNEAACLVKDELYMPSSVYRKEGHELIDGGGDIGIPLADQLIMKAVRSSGGVLRYGDHAGALGPMRHSHDLVLRHDPQRLAELESARRKKLSRKQENAIEDLHGAVMRYIAETLPVMGSSKARIAFNKRLMEALEDSSTERAVLGVRTRLKEARRPVLMHGKSYDSTHACLAADRELARIVDESFPSDFWARLARCHAELLEEPDERFAIMEREGLIPSKRAVPASAGSEQELGEPSAEPENDAVPEPTASAEADADPPAVDSDADESLAVGRAFFGFETGIWQRIDSPFGCRPSLRYTLLAFFSEGSRPNEDDATLLNELEDEASLRGVDLVGVTVLSESESLARIGAVGLRTPWVSIDSAESVRLGFSTADAGTCVLVDPCGRVAWRGPLKRVRETIEASDLRTATVPRSEEGSQESADVRSELASGRIARALTEAERLEGDEGTRYRTALTRWIEGRIGMARQLQAAGRLAQAERIVELLEQQVDTGPGEGQVKELRKALESDTAKASPATAGSEAGS